MHTSCQDLLATYQQLQDTLIHPQPSVGWSPAGEDFAFHKLRISGLHLIGHRVNRIGHYFTSIPVVLDGAMLILLVVFSAVTEGHEGRESQRESFSRVRRREMIHCSMLPFPASTLGLGRVNSPNTVPFCGFSATWYNLQTLPLTGINHDNLSIPKPHGADCFACSWHGILSKIKGMTFLRCLMVRIYYAILSSVRARRFIPYLSRTAKREKFRR